MTIWSLMWMVNFSHDSYDKCDDFDFLIVNFPYLSSNILEIACIWCFFVSQLSYARVNWFKMWRFSVQRIYSSLIMVSKLLKQGYSSRTTFRKFYGRHTYLVHKCDTSVSHMFNDLFTDCDICLVSSCFE